MHVFNVSSNVRVLGIEIFWQLNNIVGVLTLSNTSKIHKFASKQNSALFCHIQQLQNNASPFLLLLTCRHTSHSAFFFDSACLLVLLDILLHKDNLSFLLPRADECLLNGSITSRHSFSANGTIFTHSWHATNCV